MSIEVKDVMGRVADIRALLPEPGPFTVEIDAGVVDVVCELVAEDDDVIVVPPLT
ncbi:hypothetical protein ABGB18_45175 [Nonomuraea sp. B12E4]|uniref:hypothetical protein n=1 Tax=Nonomuraea sp. B12E4 TaxID=3153564 RepID=UPI00325F4A0B